MEVRWVEIDELNKLIRNKLFRYDSIRMACIKHLPKITPQVLNRESLVKQSQGR